MSGAAILRLDGVSPHLGAGDLALGLDMARFSAAAYPETGKVQSPESKVQSLVWIIEGQFSAIVIKEAERTTISVTGTRNLANFITDARCAQIEMGRHGKIKAHAGFLEGLNALWPRLVKTLYAGPDVHLTGHSLGAAIARLIFARMLLRGFPKPAAIVTIGEPRSLNHYGARMLDDADVYSRRWVNKLDVVPRIPLLTLWPPCDLFWHCRHDIWMNPAGGVDVDRPWWKKMKLDARGIRMERRARKGDPLISDHSAEHYMKTMSELANP